MGKKQIALWCVLVDFVALTAYAVYAEGYFTFMSVALEFATQSIWGAQILIDFLVALSVALGWVIADARKRDLAYWPFVVLTLTLGSILRPLNSSAACRRSEILEFVQLPIKTTSMG